LSNGNLTATHSNSTSNSGARNIIYQSTGKYYFEITVTTTTAYGNKAGILLSTVSYDAMVQFGHDCFAIECGGGTLYSNNGSAAGGTTPVVNGDVLGFAIDLTARVGWVRKNGGAWSNAGNPATGTGGAGPIAAGAFAPAVGFQNGSGDAMTANFGATAYANAAPSGFSNWPGA
jgi:hypothetical protein